MKGTEFKTTTIVSFSVYSLSNYGLSYGILMRVSYTWSIFVTLTFHPLPVLLLSFLFPSALLPVSVCRRLRYQRQLAFYVFGFFSCLPARVV